MSRLLEFLQELSKVPINIRFFIFFTFFSFYVTFKLSRMAFEFSSLVSLNFVYFFVLAVYILYFLHLSKTVKSKTDRLFLLLICYSLVALTYQPIYSFYILSSSMFGYMLSRCFALRPNVVRQLFDYVSVVLVAFFILDFVAPQFFDYTIFDYTLFESTAQNLNLTVSTFNDIKLHPIIGSNLHRSPGVTLSPPVNCCTLCCLPGLSFSQSYYKAQNI